MIVEGKVPFAAAVASLITGRRYQMIQIFGQWRAKRWPNDDPRSQFPFRQRDVFAIDAEC